ncbi:MAG: 30S ribosomal protein S27ae [Candidatus Aenigmarchaeota archaeon]|nr:30S ribosomal protein S27ae [Candidatus Aenigmarchaeota archaeon]MCK5333227.1 30S ribosomal protein S27ae [Candidatus Aenigmarchaeota archaeon]
MPKKPKSKSKGKKVKRWELYEVKDGKASLKNKVCPKCTSILAENKGRKYCGKCRYTEILKKSE